jgi:dihydroflavonol-4-reductase
MTIPLDVGVPDGTCLQSTGLRYFGKGFPAAGIPNSAVAWLCKPLTDHRLDPTLHRCQPIGFAPMRVAITGATGFLGGRIVHKLRDRGDEVVALVRRASQATILTGMGCEVLEGTMDDRVAVERLVEGVDGVFHIAGHYEIGLPKVDCPKMQDTNIGGTRRVVDASVAAGVKRLVYASSIVTYGNTRGEVVDETYKRDLKSGFSSCYDESKYRAHVLMETRVQQGAPVVFVAPGVIYGPGDHSEIGREILQAARGELKALMLTDVGFSLAYVDDVAEGFLLAFDKGEVGHTYNLAGDNVRLIDVLRLSARLAGRDLPKRKIPTAVLNAVVPIAPFLLPKLGYPPNLRELIAMADGVTFWAKDEKARRDLGYEPRSLEDGIRRTLQRAGVTTV